jgi:hypothetical protein
VRRTQAFSFSFPFFHFCFSQKKYFSPHEKFPAAQTTLAEQIVFAGKYFPARRRGFFRQTSG